MKNRNQILKITLFICSFVYMARIIFFRGLGSGILFFTFLHSVIYMGFFLFFAFTILHEGYGKKTTVFFLVFTLFGIYLSFTNDNIFNKFSGDGVPEGLYILEAILSNLPLFVPSLLLLIKAFFRKRGKRIKLFYTPAIIIAVCHIANIFTQFKIDELNGPLTYLSMNILVLIVPIVKTVLYILFENFIDN